ncbi:hypothetical protein [Neorhizobium sp. T7_12]|uniref:hypothetical protein n=1 Tax=Neorhizobium sp. T7_12 TaxID=2093832 RepID=UPI00155E85E1|nr:hypothetical protein [Neorhizobium sp. T7_12]
MPVSVKPGFHLSPKGIAQIDELDFEIRTARAEFYGENARRLPKNAAPLAAAPMYGGNLGATACRLEFIGCLEARGA